MERLTLQQRWIIVAVALVLAAFCLYQFVYWVAIVVNHPWLKHWLVYAILTLIFLGVAIYFWPRGMGAETAEMPESPETSEAPEALEKDTNEG